MTIPIMVTSQATEVSGGWWVWDGSQVIDAVRYTLTNPSAGTGTLRVKFKRKLPSRGRPPDDIPPTYEYYDVPEETYLDLVNCGSPGKLFAARIRNTFETRRLTSGDLQNEEFENQVNNALAPPRPAAVDIPQVSDAVIDNIVDQDDFDIVTT